jgi:hypothetical protein
MDSTALRRSIPDSILPYPKGAWNRTKYVFWRVITPFHTKGRDILTHIGILNHNFRQNFVLGKMAPEKKVEDLLKYLEVHGYGNHFIAWIDPEEAVSVRKLETFERQWHLRVFSDGEVRGHYEYTPEAHPYWHMVENGIEDRRQDFMDLLGDWIIPSQEEK